MAKDRFRLLSEEDLQKLSEKSESKNTKRSTSTWLNAYQSWAKERSKKPDLENYTANELDTVLSQFYAELTKKDGKEYEPDSLRVMQASLHRYLKDKNYPKSIITDIDFTKCNKILEGKARTLRENGLGRRPNASRALTNEEEEILWKAGKLGKTNPKALLHTVWFLTTQHFGLRGRQEHTTMSMDNFLFKTDESGEKYVEFLEDPTKTRYKGLHHKPRVTNPKMFSTDGDRCPVKLLEYYISKRPDSLRKTGRFYLTPKANFTNSSVWYTASPVGKNTISSFMKALISDTEISLDENLTNHSLRKNTVKKLKEAEIPETAIIKVTGHTSTKGLSNYDPGDQQEFKRMSNAISGKRPISAVLSQSSFMQSVQPQSSSNANVFNNCTFNINQSTLPKPKKRRKCVIYSDSESSQSQ